MTTCRNLFGTGYANSAAGERGGGSALPLAAAGFHQHIQYLQILLMADAPSLPRSRLVNDDHVEHRQHRDLLADRAEACVRSAVAAGRVWSIPDPPEMAVAEWAGPPAFRIHL